MPSPINKKVIKRLATLARFELTEREEEKLRKDLQSIIAFFGELQELNTEHITPIAGGTHLRSIFREDRSSENTHHKSGVEDFPEKDNGFLKVPPIFENND